MMKVAILGCGPAGLMAAHGVVKSVPVDREGVNLRIFSRRRISPLYGAQYLHAPIPGMTYDLDPQIIEYRLRGTVDDYRRKVYGQLWDGTVSPEDLAVPHNGWDIRQTYMALWRTYSHVVKDVWVDPLAVRKIINDGYDLIINTIPRDVLCYRGHTFGFTEIFAAGDAPDLGIDIGNQFRCEDDTVVCNGDEHPSWYRMSRVFGHTTVEWPANVHPPINSGAMVRKPTYHACDCWDGKLHHVGRYGTWAKGVLSHEAFSMAKRITEAYLRGEEVASA